MKKIYLFSFIFSATFFISQAQLNGYHPIQKDTAGNIMPWYNPNHGSSYNDAINRVWNFWKNLPLNGNGHKYYMTDHSYSPGGSSNKVGGDQFAMALSSWTLFYAYSGDTDLVKDMVYIADHYLDNSMSLPTDSWPNIPYPCNIGDPTKAVYDGDYILGVGFTQPDKAGSIGAELVNLYKITGRQKYLDAAVKIANTLAVKVQPGDSTHSPYAFKLNAVTGVVPTYSNPGFMYTGNVVPTMRLFEDLSKMQLGNTVQYDTAYNVIKRWVQNCPQKTNNWGCFFEDIAFPSNTETNAVTMAMYILEHPNWSATWQQDARNILDWTLTALGSHNYDTLGVTGIYEQSIDLYEGGSHTSRFAATELLYAEKTTDTSRNIQSQRQLDWATYVVDFDGKCLFSPRRSAIWYTDGYGDYVRHYLRAMAAAPYLAPDSANHLLRSSSVVSYIKYEPHEINYSTYDAAATEILRLTSKPLKVKVNGIEISETVSALNTDGWRWITYQNGSGVLEVRHDNGKQVDIIWDGAGVENISGNAMLFELYPNPASDIVQITFAANNQEEIKIDITDILGKKLKGFTIAAGSNGAVESIRIEDLKAGSYLVRLSSGNTQAVRKLTIAR